MLYLEHRKAYLQYEQALKGYERIINEYEAIAQRVQPRSPLANHEREFSNDVILPAGGGAKVEKALEYTIAMQQRKIEERLYSARLVMQERSYLLEEKEKELRKSRNIYNLIYCLKWVDGLKADAIIQETGYSRSQIYNIIGHIARQLERSE